MNEGVDPAKIYPVLVVAAVILSLGWMLPRLLIRTSFGYASLTQRFS